MDKIDHSGQQLSASIRKNLYHVINEAIDEALGGDMTVLERHSRQEETLAQLSNFGLRMLNIQEAAELIACDMWVTGKIEVEAIDDFDGPLLSPEVKTALTKVISVFVNRLTNAVETGRLQSEQVKRDFDENIILAETFIGIEPLAEWLYERGYSLGDAFREWHEDETDIGDRIINELIWLRSVKGNARGSTLSIGFTCNHGPVDESSQTELIAAYKSAVLENQHLRERLAKAESRSSANNEQVSPKHRRTLLALIAALLELLKAPVEHPRPQGQNQEAIKGKILEQFPWRGLGDRNIQEIFADANKAKADAE